MANSSQPSPGAAPGIVRRPCWRCGKPVGEAWLCPACGAIQPLPDAPDAPGAIDDFACLGFPRHLQLDERLLAERFHERSRLVHPDFFQTKSERERALSLEVSARVNRAYRTLRDPIERMGALIRLETGQREIAAKAPADLVEEIFELQELRERAREQPGDPQLRERLKMEQGALRQRLAELDKELQQLSARWDRAVDGGGADKPALIAAMRDRLSGRQYLINTIDDITITLEGRSDAKDRRH
ncbi:MAG: Fe-S protein assembly co-chaperone HscB [Nitrospirae bacterium]|nr:Fe-S protein assembly co-chaperone HscB [Nitrospirota bacterium]